MVTSTCPHVCSFTVRFSEPDMAEIAYISGVKSQISWQPTPKSVSLQTCEINERWIWLIAQQPVEMWLWNTIDSVCFSSCYAECCCHNTCHNTALRVRMHGGDQCVSASWLLWLRMCAAELYSFFHSSAWCGCYLSISSNSRITMSDIQLCYANLCSLFIYLASSFIYWINSLGRDAIMSRLQYCFQ